MYALNIPHNCPGATWTAGRPCSSAGMRLQHTTFITEDLGPAKTCHRTIFYFDTLNWDRPRQRRNQAGLLARVDICSAHTSLPESLDTMENQGSSFTKDSGSNANIVLWYSWETWSFYRDHGIFHRRYCGCCCHILLQKRRSSCNFNLTVLLRPFLLVTDDFLF